MVGTALRRRPSSLIFCDIWYEMICIDTTVLIDEFRAKGNPLVEVNRRLIEFGSESLVVPMIVAGEFLDGAAMVSRQRYEQALELLMRRRLVPADLSTAKKYATTVSHLRGEKTLGGRSQNDLWIAATALAWEARLFTRNREHFSGIPGLEIVVYQK